MKREALNELLQAAKDLDTLEHLLNKYSEEIEDKQIDLTDLPVFGSDEDTIKNPEGIFSWGKDRVLIYDGIWRTEYRTDRYGVFV